jgi:hypothetical protein
MSKQIFRSLLGGTTSTLGIPTATAATAINNTGFTANWQGVAGATGYSIMFMDQSNTTTNVGNTFSHVYTELTSNTTYSYKVRAYNGTTTSDWSNIIYVTTANPVYTYVTKTVTELSNHTTTGYDNRKAYCYFAVTSFNANCLFLYFDVVIKRKVLFEDDSSSTYKIRHFVIDNGGVYAENYDVLDASKANGTTIIDSGNGQGSGELYTANNDWVITNTSTLDVSAFSGTGDFAGSNTYYIEVKPYTHTNGAGDGWQNWFHDDSIEVTVSINRTLTTDPDRTMVYSEEPVTIQYIVSK